MVIKGLVALTCLMMLGLGMKSMLAPKSMVENFAVTPKGSAGLNTLRGVIGGLFLGSLAMLVTGLVTGETLWFLAVATLLGAVAIGRIVGIVVDGFEKSVVPPLIVEIVMVAIFVAAHLQLGIS